MFHGLMRNQAGNSGEADPKGELPECRSVIPGCARSTYTSITARLIGPGKTRIRVDYRIRARSFESRRGSSALQPLRSALKNVDEFC
jgi:hypothetical protein